MRGLSEPQLHRFDAPIVPSSLYGLVRLPPQPLPGPAAPTGSLGFSAASPVASR